MSGSINNILIVDYRVGNLLSVMRGVEVCGSNSIITSCPDEISNADRLLYL